MRIQVYALVQSTGAPDRLDVEFHATTTAAAPSHNASAALEAGATHVDTTDSGYWRAQRITPLGGLIARLYTINREYVRKYSLRLLPQLIN